MDRQEVLVAILLVCCSAFVTWTSATSKDKDNDAKTTPEPPPPPAPEPLPDDNRYADRFSDGYMSGAWERTDNGWVHGGYTLVSGGESGGAPVRTDVQYEVDPLGEMRVIARLPGKPQLQRSAFRIGLQPRRLPIYERMHHFHVGGDDGPHFDDDLDDDLDDDDDFFDEPSDWGFSDEWASSTKVEVHVI